MSLLAPEVALIRDSYIVVKHLYLIKRVLRVLIHIVSRYVARLNPLLSSVNKRIIVF